MWILPQQKANSWVMQPKCKYRYIITEGVKAHEKSALVRTLKISPSAASADGCDDSEHYVPHPEPHI